MMAFTVYQPYAYAIVAGLKGYETRPRRTNIRGRVAVHAGKQKITLDSMRVVVVLSEGKKLHYGAVLGTVEIVDCVHVEDVVDGLTERERALGDYSPGRWAWVLKNPVMFDTPIPARGKQGWWEWDEGLPEWKRFLKNGYCGRPEWADEEGCPMDNPNEEMKDCSGCRWFKETEEQE